MITVSLPLHSQMLPTLRQVTVGWEPTDPTTFVLSLHGPHGRIETHLTCTPGQLEDLRNFLEHVLAEMRWREDPEPTALDAARSQWASQEFEEKHTPSDPRTDTGGNDGHA